MEAKVKSKNLYNKKKTSKAKYHSSNNVIARLES